MTLRRALVETCVTARRRHRFYRARPADRRPETIECQCGAVVRVTSEDPWDDFERHRADVMVDALLDVLTAIE